MGRIERAKSGQYHGGSNIPIGYDYIDSKLVINDYEALQVREAFKLYSEGVSITKIHRQFLNKGYTNKHSAYTYESSIIQ